MRVAGVQPGMQTIGVGCRSQRIRRQLACLLITAALARADAFAQSLDVKSPAVDVRTTVRTLLRSADPVQRAWGAWWSTQFQIRDVTDVLQDIVASYVEGASVGESVATDLALDALIQFRAVVPSDLAMRAYERRPAQALILLALNKDADEALLTIAHRESGLPWFAASNLLLERRAAGFAEVLLQNLTLSAQLTITLDGSGYGGGFGGGTGRGCGGGAYTEGLPPWPWYELRSSARTGMLVLAQGPRPVYYERFVGPPGRGPSGGSHTIGGPQTSDRIEYLNVLAGTNNRPERLRGYESYSVQWRDGMTIEDEVANVHADLVRRYRGLLQALIDRQALSEEAARAFEVPATDIVVHDRRNR
jgi:hypothetical protein